MWRRFLPASAHDGVNRGPGARDWVSSGDWFLYVLLCADETLYAGVTTDLGRRLSEHNSGQGARYTSGRRPVCPIGAWPFQDQSAAQRAEAQFRRLPRRRKLQYVTQEKPFAGSAFCQDREARALLTAIRFCPQCGQLEELGQRPEDSQAQKRCTACGHVS